MCNLYSQGLPRQTMLQLFNVSDNRGVTFEPQASVFPGHNSIVIRNSEDGTRECVQMNWGFVLHLKNQAPKRVTNYRDDKLNSRFWSASFHRRRCLVPVTSYAEPKGRKPATWHWFALSDQREPFAFAGIWQSYKGLLKKDGEAVDMEVYSFMTTSPNSLVATVHPSRMPVMLVGHKDQDQWLNGMLSEALQVVRSYPSENMAIVQCGPERQDLSISNLL